MIGAAMTTAVATTAGQNKGDMGCVLS